MEQRLKRILDKSTFNNLMQFDNRLAFFHLAVRIFVESGLVVGLALSSSNYILIAILILVIGFWHSFWGYAGYSHELFHGRVFSSKRLNRVLFVFSTAITFNNRAFFMNSHSRHHNQTFHESDEETFSSQSWGRLHVILYCLVDFQLIFRKLAYTFKNAAGFVPDEYKMIKSSIIRSALEILTINTLLYALIWFLSGEVFIAFYFFVAQFSCQLPAKILAQAQHLGLKSRAKEGPFGHSRTIILPRILSFLYSNMNYHCEHHLLPAVSYYNLPAVNKLLKDSEISFNECGMSYFFGDFWNDLEANENRI